ncbi:hypothetical protein G7Z12_00325 [Streptomyces sp. ID38640]|uniref:hypothetical protein n=1 Tax=Streptomyces sp. ID38640 TaxID=1265399 RepID=UPI00140EEEBB|nr:hypothetical protein [Streptomyces sp. ID38640]QIK04753.1 hypothetical protein G7Z12_00325 [Streptomyces sp. ID38640]
MSSKTSVDPGELRAAAHAEDSISQDMTDKNRKAISTTKDAGALLRGWSLSEALLTVADTWGPALDGMRQRAATGASNLRICADGHEWNDAAASKDFEATGAQAQSAPQTMSAFGGPGGVGSEGRYAMPGSGLLRDSLQPDSTIGGPGAVGSEGTSPVANPAFVDRGDASHPGRDASAEWTTDEMQNAKPMRASTGDSPFG